jgi:hypothetical protein
MEDTFMQRRNLEETEELELQLKVAASRFEVEVGSGAIGSSLTDAKVNEIAGNLKTTVMLIEDKGQQLCLIASDFTTYGRNSDLFFRREAAKVLGIDISRIITFSSHSHSVTGLIDIDIPHYFYQISDEELPKAKLTSVGERFISLFRQHLSKLPEEMEPAKVLWSQGHEDRITYNRKGRRADGSTYFMREEDRQLIAKDFKGDVDPEVPVVVFQGQNGKPIAAILQFTGHPVTSYHPEHPVIFGDYPTVAADILGQALGEEGNPVPVAFMQGCCGDVNAKEMFVGGVSRAREFGEMLGQSAVDALADLKPSHANGMDYAVEKVSIPLASLPDKETLLKENAELKDYVRRANAGDEDTLSCVGLNFTRALSPKYRSELVKYPLDWNEWALNLYKQGREDKVKSSLDVSVYVLRLGDVAIIGIPF